MDFRVRVYPKKVLFQASYQKYKAEYNAIVSFYVVHILYIWLVTELVGMDNSFSQSCLIMLCIIEMCPKCSYVHTTSGYVFHVTKLTFRS